MKHTLLEKIKYRFDNSMSKGTVSMIRLLAVVSLAVVGLLSLFILLLSGDEEMTVGGVVWNNIATVINAWMPYSDEGDVFYLVFTAIAAVAGLLVTSVLIGIFTNAVEEKIDQLRKGKSVVLEEGHTVILGYKAGETTLIDELIKAYDGEKCCILIASDMEKDEMEDNIRENIEIPKTAKIICRTVDICDPVSLECCSIPGCKSVVVSPDTEGATFKTLLAVNNILKDYPENDVRIVAGVNDEYTRQAVKSLGISNLVMIGLHNFTARLVAHSCTQPGISKVFHDIIDFSGSEFYFTDVNAGDGVTFGEFAVHANGGIPLGYRRDGTLYINPDPQSELLNNEEILFYGAGRNSLKYVKHEDDFALVRREEPVSVPSGRVLILGYSAELSLIIEELLPIAAKLELAGLSSEQKKEIEDEFEDAFESEKMHFAAEDIYDGGEFEVLASRADHVILMSDSEKDEEEEDTRNMMILLRLRRMKEVLGYTFNITAEMRLEKNRELVLADDRTDFIIASNLVGMILAQLTETTELYSVFKELLSWEGNEIYLKSVSELGIEGGSLRTSEIRKAVLEMGYLLMGVYDDDILVMDPDADAVMTVDEDDILVLIGEK